MNKEEYIQALEKERRKIRVFQRELPLCLDLVTRTIESVKQGLSCSDTINAESSEQTSSEGRVLEEFIPVKRVSDCAQEQGDCKEDEDVNSRKSDWLKLWNQNPDPDSNSKLSSPRKVAIVELQRNRSAFHPFNNTSPAKDSTPPPPPTSNSTAETGGSKKKQDKESQRKVRRCWSPELHERFLQALQKLGGSQSATPKQIREVMQVEGLTNDEVKSHLQKYRLHTRRPGSSSTIPATAASSAVTEARPQYVAVEIGRLLVQPEFTAMGGSGTTTTAAAAEETSPEIYAPVAKHPHPFGES